MFLRDENGVTVRTGWWDRLFEGSHVGTQTLLLRGVCRIIRNLATLIKILRIQLSQHSTIWLPTIYIFFLITYNVWPVIYKAVYCVRVKARKSECPSKVKWLMVTLRTSRHRLKIATGIFAAEQNKVAKRWWHTTPWLQKHFFIGT